MNFLSILRRGGRLFVLPVVALIFAGRPASAEEKTGMPDLAQVEQTCLPTATANLILWFGHHGYPKLIMDGADNDERELHTLHRIMADTDARFDWGTRMDTITVGIEKYIRDAGYRCEVEYRGLDGKGAPFSADWLQENDDPNKGFILLLSYCHVDPLTHTYTQAWNAGHAVTLVNAEPGTLLIHDPAHQDDETGRKIVTPCVIQNGTWHDYYGSESVAGLMLLSGSLLEGPQDGTVLLSGAVCITMHPLADGKKPEAAVASKATPAGAGNPSSSWLAAIFNYFFMK